MRLTHQEHQAITSIVNHACEPHALYLFGSCADDNLRGGDIDLLLEPKHSLSLKKQIDLQHRLINACERKVDLLVKNPGKAMQAIHQIAQQGIRLI